MNSPPDTDHKSELGFRRDVEVLVFPGLTFQENLLPICDPVLFSVLFCLLEDSNALLGIFLIKQNNNYVMNI
jgi:hypothetical protein